MNQLENSTTVSPIRHDSDGRYSWTVTTIEWGETTLTEYFTDKGGTGLWTFGQYPGDLKQLLGHGQFNLSNCSPSTRRRRVLGTIAD